MKYNSSWNRTWRLSENWWCQFQYWPYLDRMTGRTCPSIKMEKMLLAACLGRVHRQVILSALHISTQVLEDFILNNAGPFFQFSLFSPDFDHWFVHSAICSFIHYNFYSFWYGRPFPRCRETPSHCSFDWLTLPRAVKQGPLGTASLAMCVYFHENFGEMHKLHETEVSIMPNSK